MLRAREERSPGPQGRQRWEDQYPLAARVNYYLDAIEYANCYSHSSTDSVLTDSELEPSWDPTFLPSMDERAGGEAARSCCDVKISEDGKVERGEACSFDSKMLSSQSLISERLMVVWMKESEKMGRALSED